MFLSNFIKAKFQKEGQIFPKDLVAGVVEVLYRG